VGLSVEASDGHQRLEYGRYWHAGRWRGGLPGSGVTECRMFEVQDVYQEEIQVVKLFRYRGRPLNTVLGVTKASGRWNAPVDRCR